MGFYFSSVFEHRVLTDKSQEIEDNIQYYNRVYTWIFYSYIGAIIFLFSFLKFWRRLYVQNRSIRTDVQAIARPARFIRRWCIRKAFWPFATRGHMLVIFGYLLLNILIGLMSGAKDFLVLQLARRAGWLSVVNFSLLILLSMKNTPFSWLTGYSYERLNFLHRWVGFVAWVEGSVHTIAISFALSRLVPNQTYMLLSAENIAGIVGLAAWTIMLLSFPLLKQKFYEWFFIIHIAFFPIVTVALYLHNVHCQIPILVGAGIYVLDRLIRSNRFFWHNRHAKKLKATIKVIPDGSTIVKVPRGNVDWQPGSHAFLNIPRIRYLQSHPFTIASVGDEKDLSAARSIEFIIKPKHGFTRALGVEARKSLEELPRGFTKEVTAYIDGPYGGPPDFNGFDRVILLGAGAGITFILPIALSLVRSGRVKTLDFIWSIRETQSIEGIREQLLELSKYVIVGEHGTAVNLRIHITGSTEVPSIGTLQRIKSFVRREPMYESTDYDLYGSTMSLPMPEMPPMPPIPPIQEKNYPRSIDSGTWMSGANSRVVSGEIQIGGRIVSGESQFSTANSTTGLAPQPSLQQQQPSSPSSPQMVLSSPTLLASPLPHHPSPQLTPDFRYMPISGARRGRQSLSRSIAISGNSTPTSEHARSRSPSMAPALQTEPDIGIGIAMPGLAVPAIGGQQASDASTMRSSAASTPRPGDRELRRSLRDPLKRFFVYGRPSIPHLIADVVMHSDLLETIGVAACGVTKWTDEARKVVADSMQTRGPSMSLFCEEFGY
ncbi:MAG: hypothetical protein M1814_005302 [Vezdaea aestivalis]|nr:MAG: hypothetical protein M1814_005302 [Vezdaea aestivalis]